MSEIDRLAEDGPDIPSATLDRLAAMFTAATFNDLEQAGSEALDDTIPPDQRAIARAKLFGLVGACPEITEQWLGLRGFLGSIETDDQ